MARRHPLRAGAAALLLGLALRSGLAAQVAERTETPPKSTLRVSATPLFLSWDRRYALGNPLIVDGEREPLGADLTTDSLGAPQIPSLGPAQATFRQLSGDAGYAISFGKSTVSLQAQHRSFPVELAYGLTDRLAVGVTVPLIRTEVRTAFTLDSTTANVGWNPVLAASGVAGGDSIYGKFFTEFDTTLAQLQARIAAGTATCSPAQATALAARATQVRDGLKGVVLGQGGPQSPVLPRAASGAGIGIDTTVDGIQRDFLACGASGFTQQILLPTTRLDRGQFEFLLVDSAAGFRSRSLAGVRRRRWALGDIELSAKYRYLDGHALRGAAAVVLRLPTGGLDHSEDFLDLSPADHQPDLELRLFTEWVPAEALILFGGLRYGRQLPATLERRVAPPWAPLASAGYLASVRRDLGDYLDLEFAPMIQLAPGFTAGVSVRYHRKDPDQTTYASAADSLGVATRTGQTVSAGVLDAETWEREYRVSGGIGYTAANVQAGFFYESSFSGGGGRTPSARRFQFVLRTFRKLF